MRVVHSVGRPKAGCELLRGQDSRAPEDYRVLERLPLDEKSVPEKFKGAGEPVRWVVILDTETTGFGPDDRVLELAIVRCGIDASGNLCSVDEMLDEFNDPGFEIPAGRCSRLWIRNARRPLCRQSQRDTGTETMQSTRVI